MRIDSAIYACAVKGKHEDALRAIDAWDDVAAELAALGANNERRVASMIGQCAHESGGFVRLAENLWYRAARLREVFPKYFKTDAIAKEYEKQPKKIANRVYADRMDNGNEASGDGWKFRGRGYLQLTGRENYRTYGKLQSVDLEVNPGAAMDPETAWLIAANYYKTRKRDGFNLFHWADKPDHEQVTLGINGGRHGMADRILLTGRAFKALRGTFISPMEKQVLLTDAGFDLGTIDGDFGKKSKLAMAKAETKTGKKDDALWAHLRKKA